MRQNQNSREEVQRGEENGAGDNHLEGSGPHGARKGETPAMRCWPTTTLDDAISLISTIYNKIVAFSPSNILEILKCNAAKEFVKEITFLLREYIHESHFQTIALEAIATLPFANGLTTNPKYQRT